MHSSSLQLQQEAAHGIPTCLLLVMPCALVNHVLLRRRVIVKLGPRYDMGDLLPKEQEGWKVAVSGIDFCVWEKAGDGA